MLRAVVLGECPVSEGDDYRLEVLVSLPRLERLDKDPFTEDERADAEEVCNSRINTMVPSAQLFLMVQGSMLLLS